MTSYQHQGRPCQTTWRNFCATFCSTLPSPYLNAFRRFFSLRNLKGPGPRDALIQATRDSSNLLAHEAAFALGQMQDAEAIPALEAILNNLSLHPIVRHEAAKTLGAIGLESNIPLLKNSLVLDPTQEVRETCELAL